MSSRTTDFESQALEFCIILDCPEDSKYSIDYISGVAAIGASGKFVSILERLHRNYTTTGMHRSGGLQAGRAAGVATAVRPEHGDREVMRAQLLGLIDQWDQQTTRRGAAGFCRATAQWELTLWILQVRYEKARGLAGVEFVVSDNREGLKAAVREPLPERA